MLQLLLGLEGLFLAETSDCSNHQESMLLKDSAACRLVVLSCSYLEAGHWVIAPGLVGACLSPDPTHRD